MFYKRFVYICSILLTTNLIIENGNTEYSGIQKANDNTQKLNNNNFNKDNNDNVNNKKQNQLNINKSKTQLNNNNADNLLNTLKQNARNEIIKDTQNRSKVQEHINSYLPAKLPKQLITCMENALKNNEQIKEFQAEISATHEDHNIARSNLMPTIKAESKISTEHNYSKNRQEDSNKSQGFSDININKQIAGITLNYNLFRGGADVATLKSTDKSIEAKWKEYEAKIQNILQEVATKYFEIVGHQKKINHIKSLLKARKETYRVAKQMLEAGTAKELDVAQASVGIEEVQSRLVSAEAEEQKARAVLKQLTGVEVHEKLDAKKELFDKTFSKGEALNIASKNNPNIKALTTQYNAEKLKLSAQHGSFLPKIDLEAKYDMQFSNEITYDQYDHVNPLMKPNKQLRCIPSIAIALSVPIFSGGQIFANQVKQSHNVAKVAISKEKVYQEIESNIVQILESLDAIEQNIKSVGKIIKAQDTILKTIKEEHAAGTKLMTDVLDAQQKLFEAKTMLTNNINERYVQQCKLMALLGWFNPKDLKLKGLQFDYVKEYNKQINRGIPTFEEMGIETMKPIVKNNKPKGLRNIIKR
ncbi:MAG: TolC family protein [Alphaproteobacteria bacterium]|nr:TolC family protein [Alphaproteobacteria bacterium]